MSGLPGMREYSQNENTSKWDDDSDCTDSSSEAGSQQEDCEVASAPRAAAAALAPAGLWRAPPAAGGDASDQQLAAGRSAGVGASARPRGAAAAVGPLATTAVPSASLAQGAAASRLPTAAERRAGGGGGSAAAASSIPAPVQASLSSWLQGGCSASSKRARDNSKKRAEKKRAERVEDIANTLAVPAREESIDKERSFISSSSRRERRAHHRNIANPILVSVSQYNTLSGWSSRSLLSSAELSCTKYMTAHGTKCTTATAVY